MASNISPIVDSVPVESMPFLVNPSDCQSCVETVLDFHRGNAPYPFSAVEKHINDHYASGLNFERFLNAIRGC